MKVLSQLSLAKQPRATSPGADDRRGMAAEPQRRIHPSESKPRVRSSGSRSQRYTMEAAGAKVTTGPGNMQRVCSLPYDSKASRRMGKVDVYYNQDGTTLSTTSSTERSSEDLPNQTVPKRKAFRDRFMKSKPSSEDPYKKTESRNGPVTLSPAAASGTKSEQKRLRKKMKEKARRDRALGKYALKIVACTHKATDREFEQFLARQAQAGLDYQVVTQMRGNDKQSPAVEYKAVSAESHKNISHGVPSAQAKRPNDSSQTKVTDKVQRQRERQMMRDTLDEIELTLGNKFGYKLTQTEMVKHLSSVASSLNISVERILADKTAAYEILQSHLLTTLRRARESEPDVYDSDGESFDTATSQNALGSDVDADDDASSCSYGDSQSEFSKWAYELEDEDSRAAASFVRELFSNLSGMNRSLSGSRASTEEAIIQPNSSVSMTMGSSTPKTQDITTSVVTDRSKRSNDRSISSNTLNSSADVNSLVTDRDGSVPSQTPRFRYSMEGNYRTKTASRRKTTSTNSDGGWSDSSAVTSDEDDEDDEDVYSVEMGGLMGAMQAAFRPILQSRLIACGEFDDFSAYRPSCASYSYHCQ